MSLFGYEQNLQSCGRGVILLSFPHYPTGEETSRNEGYIARFNPYKHAQKEIMIKFLEYFLNPYLRVIAIAEWSKRFDSVLLYLGTSPGVPLEIHLSLRSQINDLIFPLGFCRLPHDEDESGEPITYSFGQRHRKQSPSLANPTTAPTAALIPKPPGSY